MTAKLTAAIVTALPALAPATAASAAEPAKLAPAPLADPSIYVAPDGQIEEYGTGGARRYKNADDYKTKTNAQDISQELSLVNPDGSAISRTGVWDFMKFSWPANDGRKIAIYTGAMSVTADGKKEGRWPQDNITRRSYQFFPDGKGHLVRSEKPLFGEADHKDWVGHTYGRSPLQDAKSNVVVGPDGKGILYYEKIGRMLTGAQEKPVTEIYARTFQVITRNDGTPVLRVDRVEHKILGVKFPSGTRTRPAETQEDVSRTTWIPSSDPAVKREDGAFLMEGPRVTRVELNSKTMYVMGFSAGDYNSDKYGIYFAMSESPFGPFTPIEDGRHHLRDFAIDFKLKGTYSWIGRPFLWQDPRGQYQVTFHAQPKILPQNVDARRSVTLAIDLQSHGNSGLLFVPAEIGASEKPATDRVR